MSDQQAALEALPPSAKLALLHAQASNGVEGSEGTSTPEEPSVPCADDPVVVDNSAFAEPIIAGDLPVPIGQHSPAAPAPAKEKKRKEKLDLSSETAFPSLSAAAPRAPVTSAWSASAASRVKSSQGPISSSPRTPASSAKVKSAAASSGPSITDILELPANQQIANLPNKPLGFKSSADVIQQVMSKTGTNIIASTNRSGTTTFLIQGPAAEVARAKRELVAGLVIKVFIHNDAQIRFCCIHSLFSSALSRSVYQPPLAVSSLVARAKTCSRLKPNLVFASISPERMTKQRLDLQMMILLKLLLLATLQVLALQRLR